MDTPIILTHCKLYHSLEEIIKNLDEILNAHEKKPIHIYLASPISYLKELSSRYDPELITIGSEMMLNISEGAFTASIAGRLLKESGAHFVLIGSDAERKLKEFRPDMIASKVLEARKNHVLPIVCVSDTQHDYADGHSKEVIKQHLLEAIQPLSPEQQEGLHIIYDAKWINNTNWVADSPGLIAAHNNFLEAVKETLNSDVLKNIHLILPIPGYSKDLLPFTESSTAWGYSLGMLNLSFVEATKTIPKVTQTKPKIDFEVESTAPIKKPVRKRGKKQTTSETDEVSESMIEEDTRDTEISLGREALSGETIEEIAEEEEEVLQSEESIEHEEIEEHVIKGPEDTDSSGEGGEGDKGGQGQNDQGQEDNAKK